MNTSLTPYGVTLLRVSLGFGLVAHGLLKALVFGPAGTAAFFESIGYPGALGYAVMFGEIVLGAALLLGVQTRWAALAALPILLGATLVHLPNGWLFSSPNGGWEFPAFWSAALLAQALLGDGALALRPGRVSPRSPALAGA